MLTDVAIKRAQPKTKPYKLADSGGLFVFITPKGSKLFRFKYHQGGKEKLASFGIYPAVSLKDAREKRDAFKRQLANGGPADAAPASPSFEAVTRDFIARQATRHDPRYREAVTCVSACNKAPVSGVIGVQTGPH